LLSTWADSQIEFWNNRLASTVPPIEPSQTRIPEIPDQTEFLKRWFEFHQGYRVTEKADGTQERVAVLGEPFPDVSPGFLPRTLAQLREGRVNDASRPENISHRDPLLSQGEQLSAPQQPMDDFLDSLLEEHDAGGAADNESISSSAPLVRRDVQERSIVGRRPRPQPRAPSGSRRARAGELARNTVDRITRVFGSREDVQRDDYQSPVSQLFGRAMENYRQAEAQRNAPAPAPPPLPSTAARSVQATLQELEFANTHPHYVDLLQRFIANPTLETLAYLFQSPTGHLIEPGEDVTAYIEGLRDFIRLHEGRPPFPATDDMETFLDHITQMYSNRGNPVWAVTRGPYIPPAPTPAAVIRHLDNTPRPVPLPDSDLVVNLGCSICYEQIAQIALIPCGHLIACEWCADVAFPLKHTNILKETKPCPMCRKKATQRVKVFLPNNVGRTARTEKERFQKREQGEVGEGKGVKDLTISDEGNIFEGDEAY